MADVTLDHPELFPAGQEVGLYREEDIHDLEQGPLGDPIEAVVVGFVEAEEPEEEGEGEVDESITEFTFTKADPTRNYVVAAQLGDDSWRYVRFAAGKLGASLKPPARYPGHKVN